MEMRSFKLITTTSILVFILSLQMSGSVTAIAQTSDQAPGPAASSKREPKKATSGLEARHRDCLAFIQRHGMSCDPSKTPTCGHDIGYVRPMSCVAP
jgi:hypothetical protein